MKRVCLFFLWWVMGGGTANGSAKGREQQNKLSIPIKQWLRRGKQINKQINFMKLIVFDCGPLQAATQRNELNCFSLFGGLWPACRQCSAKKEKTKAIQWMERNGRRRNCFHFFSSLLHSLGQPGSSSLIKERKQFHQLFPSIKEIDWMKGRIVKLMEGINGCCPFAFINCWLWAGGSSPAGPLHFNNSWIVFISAPLGNSCLWREEKRVD